MLSVPTVKFSGSKRIVAVTAAALMVSACSSDFKRFADYPGVENTASLPSQQASSSEVSSKPLDGNRSTNVKPSWQTGYSTGQRTATTRQPAENRETGTVVVRSGQTLYSIARANDMSPRHLASANNIPAPYTLRVGQRIILPGVSNPVSPAPSFRPDNVTATSAPARTQNYRGRNVHRVSAGETLFAIGRTYNVHPYKIASHNNLAKPYSLSVGQQLRIPGEGSATAWKAPVTERTETEPVRRQPQRITKVDRTEVTSQEVAEPAKTYEQPVAKAQDSLIRDTGKFRWPVRGRVISRYGAKPGGSRNEGINIAVPEGTSVRASEAGVVAYAGNELKGYGNLVLIRHEGGWVTAYAHNKELLVRRGDTVRRGEIISKAGSTGSVTSPQLHFELRKGASAVDPMKHMSSSTASY